MDVSSIKNMEDIYLKIGLYDKINLNELLKRTDIEEINNIKEQCNGINQFLSKDKSYTNYEILEKIKNFIKNPSDLNIDSFCINCKKDYAFNYVNNFILINEKREGFSDDFHPSIFFVNFYCSKCKKQEISFLFKIDENDYLYKIWQYPSTADLISKDYKKYEKFLWKDYFKELKSSIVLHSHWFWIWSFIHLRRIFEKIIFYTFKNNADNLNISFEVFLKKDMWEKIKALKGYLPNFLVKNKQIYWIVSKHIHELSEQECLDNYDILKQGIEIILDEKIEQEEKMKKEIEINKSINKLNNKYWK